MRLRGGFVSTAGCSSIMSFSSKNLHRVSGRGVQVNWSEVAFSRCKLLGSTRVFAILHHSLEDVLLARTATASIETIAVASIHSLLQKRGQSRKENFHNWTATRVTAQATSACIKWWKWDRWWLECDKEEVCLQEFCIPIFYRSFGLSTRCTKTFDAFLYGLCPASTGFSLDFRYASIFCVSICLILACRTL